MLHPGYQLICLLQTLAAPYRLSASRIGLKHSAGRSRRGGGRLEKGVITQGTASTLTNNNFLLCCTWHAITSYAKRNPCPRHTWSRIAREGSPYSVAAQCAMLTSHYQY